MFANLIIKWEKAIGKPTREFSLDGWLQRKKSGHNIYISGSLYRRRTFFCSKGFTYLEEVIMIIIEKISSLAGKTFMLWVMLFSIIAYASPANFIWIGEYVVP